MNNKTDAYDEAVKYFRFHPEGVYDAWDIPNNHNYGYLFGYLTKTRARKVNGITCGCPIMVKEFNSLAQDSEITKKCKNSRILRDVVCDEDFDLNLLEELARIQRLADFILEREPINARLWVQQNKLGDN